MIAIHRNAWSGSNGLDDRDQTESVITIDRNPHVPQVVATPFERSMRRSRAFGDAALALRESSGSGTFVYVTDHAFFHLIGTLP
jgi:hypothetical protein